MSTKTKTTVAATIAALSMPTAALAHGKDHERQGAANQSRHDCQHDKRGGDRDRGERHDARSRSAGARHERRGDHKRHRYRGWWKHGKRSVVLFGVDVAGLSVSADGKLAGPLTLDPVAANRNARRLLDLSKDKIAGEDTIQVGTAGDAVELRYHGLNAGDALLATDVIKIHGRIDRASGQLDIRKIKVLRRSAHR